MSFRKRCDKTECVSRLACCKTCKKNTQSIVCFLNDGRNERILLLVWVELFGTGNQFPVYVDKIFDLINENWGQTYVNVKKFYIEFLLQEYPSVL